jgi:adenosine kinase
MITYPVKCKERGIGYIFDPGQSLPMLTGEDLLQAIEGCRILITNDYELDLIMTKTGTEKRGLLERAGAVITTLGEQGSVVCTRESEVRVPIGKTRQVLDPTGAGDSFRGGLLSGLVKGLELGECARLGSVCASFSVECYGTQSYEFTSEEFNERLCSLPR